MLVATALSETPRISATVSCSLRHGVLANVCTKALGGSLGGSSHSARDPRRETRDPWPCRGARKPDQRSLKQVLESRKSSNFLETGQHLGCGCPRFFSASTPKPSRKAGFGYNVLSDLSI